MLKINNESTDEVVECNNEMLTSVYELEREWKDNIVVEWGQRINFPYIYDDVILCSQVLYLKGKSPVLMEDLIGVPFLYKLSLIHIWY